MNAWIIALLIVVPTLILLVVMVVVFRLSGSSDQDEAVVQLEQEVDPKQKAEPKNEPEPAIISKEQEKPAPIPPKVESKPQKTPAPSLDYCPFCGTPVSRGSYFCSDCGQAFENE